MWDSAHSPTPQVLLRKPALWELQLQQVRTATDERLQVGISYGSPRDLATATFALTKWT